MFFVGLFVCNRALLRTSMALLSSGCQRRFLVRKGTTLHYKFEMQE